MTSTKNDNPITQIRLQSILADYPFRDAPIRQLLYYLQFRDGNRVLAFGPRATGKTAIVNALVDRFQLFHATINALSHVSMRNIYETILKQLHRQLIDLYVDDEENEKMTQVEALSTTGCTNSPAFLDRLKKLLEYFADYIYSKADRGNLEKCQKKLVIVVDNADVLFKEEKKSELVYLLNNIEVLTEMYCTVSVIYICTHSVDWIGRHCDSKWDFLEVVFNNYSIAELNQLLSRKAVLPKAALEKYSPEFYASYVNVITRALNNYTRNLLELQYVCLSNFAHYTAPIEESATDDNTDEEDAVVSDDRISTKDSAKLYLRFQPRLQAVTEALNDHKTVRIKNTSAVTLSPSMNYLLVAAYLASYNSPKTDKRYFVRNQGKLGGRKRRRTVGRKSAAADKLELESKAPKPFTFERLYQLYQALINLNETQQTKGLLVSSVLQQQFAELIKQNLVLAIRPTANTAPISSAARYQLSDSVTNRQIVAIADDIGLKLEAFMEQN